MVPDTTETKAASNNISDAEWDKPMVCPIDPALLAECEVCQ